MARITADDLRLVCSSDLDDENLEATIADASAWVDAHLVGQCSGLTDASLAAVEKYLAAHFLQTQAPLVKSEKVGPLATTYATPDGATPFLDMAASFDPCGIVRSFFTKAQGSVVQFGVAPGYADDE